MLDLRVDNGVIVTSTSPPRQASVGVKEGRIVAVGDLEDMAANRIEDAGGLHVLPGLIDTHVHLGFSDEATEWSTESRAAVIGGVTTLCIYYRNPADYDTLLPGFLQQGSRASNADFIVHLGILNDTHLGRLDHYATRYGLRSIKMYTTYKHGELSSFGVMGQDDGFILDVMREVARIGDIRVSVHCENDDIVERGISQWRDEGTPGLQWSIARPDVAEVEAIRRIALFSRQTGAPVFIPHVSSRAALDTVLAERVAGTDLLFETCPQYLISDRLDRPDYLAKVNPPVRVNVTGTHLWAALRGGQVTTIGTDHACWTRADKTAEDVTKARPGFPGVGTLLPVLLDGVHHGEISLQDIARTQLNAASTFGIPGKGEIAPGNYADLVLVDLQASREVSGQALGGYSDFSPYDGLTLHGWPVLTIKRGTVVARDGQLTGVQAPGQYLRSKYTPQAQPA